MERRLAESSPEKWSEAAEGQTGWHQVATAGYEHLSSLHTPPLCDLLLVHYLSAVHHTCGGRQLSEKLGGKRAGALEV